MTSLGVRRLALVVVALVAALLLAAPCSARETVRPIDAPGGGASLPPNPGTPGVFSDSMFGDEPPPVRRLSQAGRATFLDDADGSYFRRGESKVGLRASTGGGGGGDGKTSPP